MNDEMITPDPELTAAQKSLVGELDETTLKNIDAALLSNANSNWRKVAMIVGITMSGMHNRIKGIPDVFYSQRVRKLLSLVILSLKVIYKPCGFAKSGYQTANNENKKHNH